MHVPAGLGILSAGRTRIWLSAAECWHDPGSNRKIRAPARGLCTRIFYTVGKARFQYTHLTGGGV